MAKSFLLVIDVQNGFTQIQKTIETKRRIIEFLNQHSFDHVIGTRFVNPENSMYEKLLHWIEMRSLQEVSFDPELEICFDEILEKQVYSCVNKEFLQHLRLLNDGSDPETVYLCGLATEACVLKTAIDLFENYIRPVVIKDLCFSSWEGRFSHEAGLIVLSYLIGPEQLVLSSDLNKSPTPQFLLDLV